MASLEVALMQAVVTLAQANTTLWTTQLAGRFGYMVPPPSGTKPFVMFDFGELVHSVAFQSAAPVATEIALYIKVVSESSGPIEAGDIVAQVHTVFDGKQLTVSGYRAITLRPQSDRPVWDDADKVWLPVVQFRGYATPN